MGCSGLGTLMRLQSYIGGGFVMWRLDGLEDTQSDGSPSQLARRGWLLVGGLGSSPYRCLHWALWVLFSWHTNSFPPEWTVQESKPEAAFTASPWKSHTMTLQCSVPPDLLYSVWAGTPPRPECQEQGSLGAVLEAGYHSSSLSYFIPHTHSVHSPSKNVSHTITSLHFCCL